MLFEKIKNWFNRKKRNQNPLDEQLTKEIEKFHNLNKKLEEQILNLNHLDSVELKKQYLESYLNNCEKNFVNDFNNKLKELEVWNEDRTAKYLLEIMGRINIGNYKEDLLFKTVCKNPEMKSRLIGLNGRNKKTFERTCGLELLVNEDETVAISSANLIKREIAKRVLLRLLDTWNIEPNKIENFYLEEKENFLKELRSFGEKFVKEQLNTYNLDPKIYEYVAKLKYRSSFGQNVLEHSLEVGLICQEIARLLNLDANLALLCGFFHDIGKSTDHESGNDHVEEGIKIAKECGLNETIIHSIEAHHDKVICHDHYAAIVKIADKLSASRPGARNNSKDDYLKRVKIYEEIVKQFKEVKDCWILKSGFFIKIIVHPQMVKDDELALLGYRIKQAFEENNETKTYNISLELIKENSFKLKTSCLNS